MRSLQDFNDVGITLWIEGDKLKYAGPPSVVSADVIAELREQKIRLTEELKNKSAGRLDDYSKSALDQGFNRPRQVNGPRTVGRVAICRGEASQHGRQRTADTDPVQPRSSMLHWIASVKQAKTLEETWTAIEASRQHDWSIEERRLFSTAYMPVLMRFYINDTTWTVDSRAATQHERVQIEKFRRGWFGPRRRGKRTGAPQK